MANPLSEAGGYKNLSPEQKKVIKAIVTIGRKRFKAPKARHQAIITALITGAQEAGLTNPKTSSGGSKGWRQELTQYYPDPTNLKHSVNRFYDEYKQEAGSGSLGERAQNVQASAYPSAYQPHVGEARTILRDFNRSGGGRGIKAVKSSQRAAGKASAGIPGETIRLPGTSNAGQRKLAALELIKHRFDPGAFEQFAQQKQELQDIPGKTVHIPGMPAVKGQQVAKGKRTAAGRARGPLAQKIKRESRNAPVQGNAIKIGEQVAKKFGLTVTSTTGGTHVSGSYHYQDRAIDISGDAAAMKKAFKYIQKNVPHSKITELFYDPIGHYWDNGQKVSGAIGGHDDHVHFAV